MFRPWNPVTNDGLDFDRPFPFPGETGLPFPRERLRSTTPLPAPGASSLSDPPGNSRPPLAPDGVNGPVCGPPVPDTGTFCAPPASAEPAPKTAAAAHKQSATSNRAELLRINSLPSCRWAEVPPAQPQPVAAGRLSSGGPDCQVHTEQLVIGRR